MTFGTTEQMIASSTSFGLKLFFSNRLLMSIPYSSEVLGILVVMRKNATISSFSNTPQVMLVLPTSIVSIILFLLKSLSKETDLIICLKRFKQIAFFVAILLDL